MKLKARQSLFDLALQQYGNPQMAVSIAIANNIPVSSLRELDTDTQLLATLDNLAQPDASTLSGVNTAILDWYKRNNIIPASAIADSDNPEGIEFWFIEIDFISS
jgi:hypothetical protein